MITEIEQYCKRHPDRVAKRRCYHCGDYICTECQQVAHHHVFCSDKCKWLYLITHALKKIITLPVLAFRKLIAFFKKSGKITSRSAIEFIILILLIACFVTLVFVVYYLKNLEKNYISLVGVPPYSSEFEPEQPASIVAPGPGAMVTKNRFDIEGEASDNQIISLSSNGRLLAVTMAEKGVFKFEDVHAKRGKNKFLVKALTEDGNVHTLETIEFYYGTPPMNYLLRSYNRGPVVEKKIALSFDAGATNNAAEEILNTLREKGVYCTMFLTGAFIRRYPETVRRIVADGHEVGNHTWNHPHLTTFAENFQHQTLENVTREFLYQQLQRTERLFKSITGQDMRKYWRAPFGEHNRDIRTWAAELGYRHVGWTVGRDWEHNMDTLDWVADKNSSVYHTAEEIVEKIINFGNGDEYGANGAIVLMHLGTSREEDQPHKLLPRIIDQMRDNGYTFVTISEMM